MPQLGDQPQGKYAFLSPLYISVCISSQDPVHLLALHVHHCLASHFNKHLKLSSRFLSCGYLHSSRYMQLCPHGKAAMPTHCAHRVCL